MRAYVLTDPKLAPLAHDFVWLAVDTDKDENAAFVARHPNRVWPTLYVIDPSSEEAVMRWEGTATAPELVSLLAGGARGEDAFREASRLHARGDLAGAEQAYAVAMKTFDANQPRAVEAYVSLLSARKEHALCASTAASAGPSLPPGTSRAAVLATGLACARDGKRDADVARLYEAAERAAREADGATAADDRSALFEELVETKKERGDAAGAKELARAWAAFLEAEAARATTPSARAVFDPHRLSAYLAMGEPERAVAMLAKSEADLPGDYNPPARLARAFLEMKRLEEARAAIDRAAARVYGPRSLRVFALAADIAKERGDKAAERAALEQALARTTRAVLNDSQKKLRAALADRLGALR